MATRGPSVSMKDVAALAGVSLGTVSNVVNSPGLVSDRTRERVQSGAGIERRSPWIWHPIARIAAS